MSVNSIFGSTSSSSPDWTSKIQQQKEYYDQLAQALQSGDLAAAQKAFAGLQKGMPQTSQASTQTSQMKTDMDSLAKALQSGDVSAAKTAFAAVQQDMKTGHKGHHGHHGAPEAVNSSTTSDSTTTATDSDGTTISLVA